LCLEVYAEKILSLTYKKATNSARFLNFPRLDSLVFIVTSSLASTVIPIGIIWPRRLAVAAATTMRTTMKRLILQLRC